MKKNTTIFIITIVLIIIAAVLISKNSNTTLKKESSNFALLDTSNITKIFIADKQNNSVVLRKTSSGNWKINDHYKADQRKTNMLIKTMQDIRVRNPVSLAEHNNVISRLAATAKKVEVYQIVDRIDLFGWIKLFPHEKMTKVYYVGGATMDNLGSYMWMEGKEKDRAFVVHIPNFRGFVSPRYSSVEDDWRDHSIFNYKVKEIQSIKVEYFENPDWSYKVENINDRDFKIISLNNNREILNYDTLKLLNFVNAFNNVKFEAVLTNTTDQSKIDSITLSKPAHKITVVDKKGDSTVVKTFHKEGFEDKFGDGAKLVPVDIERLYASLNNGNDFVLLQYYAFGEVLQPLTYFEKE